MKHPFCIAVLLAVCLTLMTGCATTQPQTKSNPARLRAMHVITVADDFVVNVYHNGVRVPEAKRKLVLDRFGATIERTNIEVQQGDWLVFHVVNNRLRWGGAYYFSAAGIIARANAVSLATSPPATGARATAQPPPRSSSAKRIT